MKWISVKDELPKENKFVAVYGLEMNYPDNTIPLTDKFSYAWFIKHEKGDYFCIGCSTGQPWKVLYWMEIPEFPKLDWDQE